MYLSTLSENLKGCFASLETAPLSPSIRKMIGWALSPTETALRNNKRNQFLFALNLYNSAREKGKTAFQRILSQSLFTWEQWKGGEKGINTVQSNNCVHLLAIVYIHFTK